MQNKNEQLAATVNKFVKQKHKLPKQIGWKLQYMLDYINKCQKPIQQLNQQQKNQIKDILQMSPEALKLVFISIVNSILSPNLYCSFQKNCKMKVDGLVPKWIKVYASFTQNQICFTNRKKIFKFVLDNLQCYKISQTQIQFKYKGVRKSKIKFQHEQAARNMVAKIESLIQDYKKIHQNVSEQAQIICNKNFVQNLAKDYITTYKDKSNLFFTHRKLPKIHVSLFLQGQFWDIFQLIEFFITQKYWNSKVVDQKMMDGEFHKILIERRLKSSSFFSLERRTLTQVKIIQANENCYIVEQMNHPGEVTNKNIIIGEIYSKAIFDILSPKIVKLTMDCTYNAKGYCNTSSSKSMLVDLFNDIVFIEQRYLKLKEKGKLHFKMHLKDYAIQIASRLSSRKQNTLPIVSKVSIDNQAVIGPSQNDEEEEFYSISNNTKNFHNDFQQESKNNNQFYDLSLWSEEDNQQNNSRIMQKNKIIEFQSVGNQESMGKQRSMKNSKKAKGNSFEQFQHLKLKKYDQKLSMDYVRLIKQGVHQRVYLKSVFKQKQISDYLWEKPWYDPSIILTQGTQYEINQKNELVFINYELIQGQKDSLIFVIKQVGSNLISGRSVLNVSLPVDIFQSRSLLQRSAASFGCAPKYLKPVAQHDVFSQMKAVIGFMVSVAPLQLIMLKPFNPILGQTFQAYLGGVPICYEQISHHPPISSYYMVCDEFTLYGNLVAVANVSLNSGSGGNAGKMHIIMKNGNHFQISFFPGQISGLIYGKRKYAICNKAFVFERNHHLVAELSAHKQSKGLYEWKGKTKHPTSGDILGGIFKVKQKFLKQNPASKSMINHPGLKKQDIQQKIQQISGLWFSNMFVGSEIINKDIYAFPVQYSSTLLPSDANFRMDILMHRLGDLARSQSQKQILQHIQRKDRKLRTEHKGKGS